MRRATLCLAIITFVLGKPPTLSAQAVHVRGGVAYLDTIGGSRRLSDSGLVHEALSSPDGALIAYVKGTPSRTVSTGAGDAEATELWLVRRDGSGARRILEGREAAAPESTLANLSSLRFSPDGSTIYFLSEAWATSGAVHAVSLNTGHERYICPGNSLRVLPNGQLLVNQHRYHPRGGSYEQDRRVTP